MRCGSFTTIQPERCVSDKAAVADSPHNRDDQIDRTGMATMSSTAGTSRMMNGSP
jgi:hypothetical protein